MRLCCKGGDGVHRTIEECRLLWWGDADGNQCLSSFSYKRIKKEGDRVPAGKRCLTLFWMDLEQKAIERVMMASEMSLRLYGRPLVVTGSGGKDSAVRREIVRRTEIPFETHYNLITADAPQTIYYVRDIPRRLELEGITCCVNYPICKGQRVTTWSLIPMKKFSPTRLQRHYCQTCKENSCRGRFVTTGVRWAESVKWKNDRSVFENFVSDPSKKVILNNDNDEQRTLFESRTLKGKKICNPIVDWRDSDVWEYICSERLETSPLYDMGFYRVGCLGCPTAGKNCWIEFRSSLTYQRAYIRSLGKMLDVIHAGGGRTRWKTVEDVFSWWMEEETIEG